jgi:hypothetical protein
MAVQRIRNKQLAWLGGAQLQHRQDRPNLEHVLHLFDSKPLSTKRECVYHMSRKVPTRANPASARRQRTVFRSYSPGLSDVLYRAKEAF